MGHSIFYPPYGVGVEGESLKDLSEGATISAPLIFLSWGIKSLLFRGRAGKKPRSDCPGQVNFALRQVKIEVQWPGGQVKLASVVL